MPRRVYRVFAEGEIVFLRKARNYNKHDVQALIATGEICPKATGHPVVVLRRLDSEKYVVSVVSSHANEGYRDAIPPWRRGCYRGRPGTYFRAFVGTQRPSTQHDLLHLQGDKIMPKVSWMYVRDAYEVTPSTLCPWDGPKEGMGLLFPASRENRRLILEVLQLTEESLRSLQVHIAQECPRYRPAWDFSAPAIASQCSKPEAPAKLERHWRNRSPTATTRPIGTAGCSASPAASPTVLSTTATAAAACNNPIAVTPQATSKDCRHPGPTPVPVRV